MSAAGRADYTMGVDIGSSTSKCVILRSGEDIVSSAIGRGGSGTVWPEKVMQKALDGAELSIDEIASIFATGYGRNRLASANKTFSELSCHSRGALFFHPGVRMVIDIGGQDCKVMKLAEDGRLDGFAMNDKCASCTGRFLEVMADVLDVRLSDLGGLSTGAEHIIDITSTCTVFAESEVISQLSKGADRCGLVAGIHRSVAVKAAGIAKRLGIVEPVFFSGGVSQNSGVVSALSRELDVEVITDPRAQMAGAIGAALLGKNNK